MRSNLSEQALRYRLYESIISSGLSSDHYQTIVEGEGFSQFKQFLKGLFKKGGLTPEDTDSIMGAQKKLQGSIDTIVKELKDAKVEDKEIQQLIKGILEEFLKKEVSGGDSDTEDRKPGTNQTVRMPKDPSAPAISTSGGQALVNIGARIAQENPETAAEEAKKTQKSFKELAQEIVKDTSEASRQKPEDVKKVFNYMLQKGYLQAESRRRLPVRHGDIIALARNVRVIKETVSTIDRWQVLAGCTDKRKVIYEADLTPAASKVLEKIKDSLKDDNSALKSLEAVLDAIKNDEEPKEEDFNFVRNVAVNKDSRNSQFFAELEDTVKKTMKKGAEAAKGKISDLEKELGVKAEEIKKHTAEAEDLKNQLSKNKEQQQKFIDSISKALKIEPGEFESKISKFGFEGLIAAAMAKKPDAVENAAEAAGASTASSGEKPSGDHSEKIDDIVKSTGLNKEVVEPIVTVLIGKS